MMRFIFIMLFLLSSNSHAQKMIDVIQNQSINQFQTNIGQFPSGISFFDFDEDGWDDLTYPMHNDSIIFYKNINGILTKINSFIYADGIVSQLLWVDYDNNGTLDLAISYEDEELHLYKNDGDFNFTDVSISSGIFPSVAKPYGFSFADIDQDHDLDLYVCSYDLNGSTNKFFENQGDGTFIDKTQSYGLGNGVQLTLMGVWFDYNNDGNLDLHVINDRINSNDAFYHNENGVFSDIADSLGLLNPGQNPMTSSIGDYNNDGYQDIFITDFGIDSNLLGMGPFHYKLFENQNGEGFLNVAASKNLEVPIFGWGGLWVDYDNDSFEDLYVATGGLNFNNISPNHSVLYKNIEGTIFSCINDSIVGNINTSAYCPVKGDLNNDGFYDIVVLNSGTLPNILQNEGNNNNYIKINPVGTISNRFAIGSQIRISAGGVNQLQTVFCGENLVAQNSQYKIFGVDTNTIIDSITVRFPSGIIAKRFQVPVNQTITIYEEEYVQVDITINPVSDTIILCQNDTVSITMSGYDNYNWSNGSTDTILMITNPGVYYFAAFNEYGDTLYRSEDLYVLDEPYPLYQESMTQVNCNDSVSGSAGLIFADPQSVDSVYWSNGEFGMMIDSLMTGNYDYLFISSNNCSYSGSISVTGLPDFNIETLTTAQTQSALGDLYIYVFGGAPPFTYMLNGDTVSNYVTDLIAGEYTLSIIDANDCLIEEIVTIEDESTLTIDYHETSPTAYIHNRKIYIRHNNKIQSIHVLDMTGSIIQKIEMQQINSLFDDGSHVDFEHPTGIYILVVTTANSTYRKKLFNP